MNDDLSPTEPSAPLVPSPGSDQTDVLPRQIGWFRIERILGQGGFGVVYLGCDEHLPLLFEFECSRIPALILVLGQLVRAVPLIGTVQS
jgi:serine/threonine protein kinase